MVKAPIAYCFVLMALVAAPMLAPTKSDAEAGGIQFITEESPDLQNAGQLLDRLGEPRPPSLVCPQPWNNSEEGAPQRNDRHCRRFNEC
jgi:hypothetical protein